nr:PREDICTED: uncharacterized protein LOC107078310 isoform X4 [Lepisosteus oculatus]
MASSYTAWYLQMKLKDRQGQLQKDPSGVSCESSTFTPTTRSAATFSPLAHSSSRETLLSRGGLSTHSSTSSEASKEPESYAAALKQLATLTNEPQEITYAGGKTAPDTLNLNPPSRTLQRTLGKPMHAARFTQTCPENDTWRKDRSQPYLTRHVRNNLPNSSSCWVKHGTSTSSSLPAHFFPRSTEQDAGFSSLGFQRTLSQSIPTGNGAKGYFTGFHPYISRDMICPLPSYPCLYLDSTPSTSDYFPGFTPRLSLHPYFYRSSREKTSSHRSREDKHENHSCCTTLTNAGDSELSLNREQKRLNGQKELKEEKDLDVAKNQLLSHKLSFNKSNKSPRVSYGGHNFQRLYHAEDQHQRECKFHSSMVIDPMKSVLPERTTLTTEAENTIGFESSSTSSSSLPYRIHPLSSPWPSEQDLNLNILRHQHSNKEVIPDHNLLEANENPAVTMYMKTGEIRYVKSPLHKAKGNNSFSIGTSFLAPSENCPKETFTEPIDSTWVFDLGRSNVKRDRNEFVRHHLKGSANIANCPTTHIPEFNTSKNRLTALQKNYHNTYLAQDHCGFVSMPDLLSHIPYFLGPGNKSTKQNASGNHSNPSVHCSEIHSLDSSEKTAKTKVNIAQGRKAPASNNTGSRGSSTSHCEKHRSPLEQKALDRETDHLRKNTDEPRKRGIPSHSEVSADAKQANKELLLRDFKHPTLKAGSPHWTVDTENAKDKTWVERERFVCASGFHTARPHNQCFGELNGGQTSKKEQFRTVLDMKHHVSSEAEDSDESRSLSPTEMAIKKTDLGSSSCSRENQSSHTFSEGEMDWIPKWQGIDHVFETYQEYTEERKLEESILQEQLTMLKAKNKELKFTADSLRGHLQVKRTIIILHISFYKMGYILLKLRWTFRILFQVSNYQATCICIINLFSRITNEFFLLTFLIQNVI